MLLLAVKEAAKYVPSEDMDKSLRGVAAAASVQDALSCLVAAVRSVDTELMQDRPLRRPSVCCIQSHRAVACGGCGIADAAADFPGELQCGPCPVTQHERSDIDG